MGLGIYKSMHWESKKNKVNGHPDTFRIKDRQLSVQEQTWIFILLTATAILNLKMVYFFCVLVDEYHILNMLFVNNP